MKKFFPAFFCLAVCASQVCLPAGKAGAQPALGESQQEMMTAGLKELKKSYNQLVERNNFLAAEIASYRRDLPSLPKQLEALVSQKEALIADKRAEENSQDQTDLLAVYRRKVDRLRRQIEAAELGDQQKIFLQKKEGLETLVRDSRENVSSAQLRLRDAEKQYDQQTEMVAQLREKQNRRVSEKPGDFSRGKKSADEAQSGIAADKYSEVYLAKLTGEVLQLKSYQQQLENKLSLRHSQNSSDAVAWNEERYRMYGKLSSLKEENMLLKRQLSSINYNPSPDGQVAP